MAQLGAIPALKLVGVSLLGAAAAKSQVDSVKKSITPKAQAAAPKPLLPDEDGLKRASRRAAAARFGQRGSGRVSTILSDNDNQTLGG